MHLSIFYNEKKPHGGYKRSAQISNLQKDRGMTVIGIPEFTPKGLLIIFKYPVLFLRMLPIAVWLGIRFLSVRGLLAVFYYGVWIRAILARMNFDSVSIELGANRGIVLGNLLVSLRVPFVVYPHNIEFMVCGQEQVYFRGKNSEFSAEMRVYFNSLEVKTISEFDAAVLRSLGTRNVECFPYVPSEADLHRLHRICKRRKYAKKNGILILGSVGNSPTFHGLRCLLELISERGCNRIFLLVGFGTEDLKSFAPKNVSVIGGVSSEKLEELLVKAEAVLIYQPQTSGMLTRLIETAAAGIPSYVLGGYVQASELRNGSVFSIERLDELPA